MRELSGPWPQRCSDVCNLGDTGAISADIVLLVPTMVLVLKMLNNRFAHVSYCTAVCEKICLWRRGYCVKKAPVTIDSQMEQYGNFVKHGGATSQL